MRTMRYIMGVFGEVEECIKWNKREIHKGIHAENWTTSVVG